MGPSAPRRAGGRLLRAVALGLAAFLAPVLSGGPASAQPWFDALVAEVNGQPILASDLTVEDALYGPGRSYADMDAATRADLLDQLIRRRLLLAEAERFGVVEPSAAAVDAEVARLRARLGPRPAGIDPDTLRATVRARLWADAFVDARIRAFVFIRDAEVALAMESEPPPADDDAREALEAKVRARLAAKEAKRRLDRYLARLEGRATIRRYLEPPEALDGVGGG